MRIELTSPAWKAGIINHYTNPALKKYDDHHQKNHEDFLPHPLKGGLQCP